MNRPNELVIASVGRMQCCSTCDQLCPGDVIASGTPGAVEAARTPARPLRTLGTAAVYPELVGRPGCPVVAGPDLEMRAQTAKRP